MPKFLEQKLKAEYGENSTVPYKVMNSIGAMRGNRETAKGREMARKHEADMKKMGNIGHTEPMREMRIEIHRGPKNKVTGFTVHHHMMPKAATKSGAFMENTHHSQPFGADQHEEMMDHIHEHTAAQLGGAKIAKNEAPEPEEEGEEEAG